MSCLLHVARPGEPAPEPVTLSAPGAAGGSRADTIHLPGAPPAAALLEPVAAGVVIVAQSTGLRAAGLPLQPGQRRLLRPGERAEVAGATLAVAAAARGAGTRAAAAALVRAAARGEPLPCGPHLLVLTGASAGARLPLRGDPVVGRGAGAALRLRDALVSRRHVRLRRGPDGLSVEDLGAKNGVLLNGVRLDVPVAPLRDGDELTVGGTLLAVVDPEAAPPVAPAPAPAPPPPPVPTAGEPAAAAPAPAGTRRLAAALLLACSAAALAVAAS